MVSGNDSAEDITARLYLPRGESDKIPGFMRWSLILRGGMRYDLASRPNKEIAPDFRCFTWGSRSKEAQVEIHVFC